MTEFSSEGKDLLICALVNKLGGVVSLRPNELQLGNVRAQCVQLNTGTLHLELIATPIATSDEPAQPSTTDGDTLTQPAG